MRRIVRSMKCVSVLAVLCLNSLLGCGKSTEPSQASGPSNTSVSPNRVDQPAEMTATQTTNIETTVKEVRSAKLDSATATAKDTQPDVVSQRQPEPAATTSAATADNPVEEKISEKPKRKPIYDEKADAQELIAKAVRRAQRDHKQVLIEWGGNWCGWCHLLHDCFTQVPDVAKIVQEEYELVLIDSNSNSNLLKQYAGNHQVKGFPHLTIVDAQGKVLTNQDTEPLEKGKGHDPQSVTKFLSEWMLAKVDAAQLFSEQMENAKRMNKRVLFRVGDPYCGWCKVLSQFIQDHESLFAKDYVDIKIDTERMVNGEKVAESHRPSGAQGHPWFVILDSSGKVLATSVSQKGNIGYPAAPDEIDHFMKMLRDTRQSISDDELTSIETDLNEFRIRRERKQAEQASN